MKLHFICIRLEGMAYFRRMYPVFDEITKRNAPSPVNIRIGVRNCHMCNCMGPSDKCDYCEDLVSKIFCTQILALFELQSEFSLRVGRTSRFTVALGSERSLKGPVHQKTFQSIH
jgi:hypothetical protein